MSIAWGTNKNSPYGDAINLDYTLKSKSQISNLIPENRAILSQIGTVELVTTYPEIVVLVLVLESLLCSHYPCSQEVRIVEFKVFVERSLQFTPVSISPLCLRVYVGLHPSTNCGNSFRSSSGHLCLIYRVQSMHLVMFLLDFQQPVSRPCLNTDVANCHSPRKEG